MLYPIIEKYVYFPEYLGYVVNIQQHVTCSDGKSYTFYGKHIFRFPSKDTTWQKEPIFYKHKEEKSGKEIEVEASNFIMDNGNNIYISMFYVAQELYNENCLKGTYYFTFDVSKDGAIITYYTKLCQFEENVNDFHDMYNFLNQK